MHAIDQYSQSVQPYNYLLIGCDRPSLKNLFRYVKYPITPIWFDFGIELLEMQYENKLKILKAKHGRSSEEGCAEMLELWHSNQINASWNELIKALMAPSINKTFLAEKIRGMLISDSESVINIIYQCS